jgi:hypothetical protein
MQLANAINCVGDKRFSNNNIKQQHSTALQQQAQTTFTALQSMAEQANTMYS